MAPRLKEKVNITVKENLPGLAASGGASKKTAKPASGGRRMELSKIDDLATILTRTISDTTFNKLALIDEHGFMAAVREVEMRLAGQRATVDMAVGTFLEVIGPDHPLARDLRERLKFTNVGWAVDSHALGEAVFIAAGTAPDMATARAKATPLDGIGEGVDFYWREGKGTPQPGDLSGSKTAGGKAGKTDAAQIADVLTNRRNNLDTRRIQEIRDMSIDGSKFCDRGIVLELQGGKWLLLLSEEYKNPQSGGATAQTAIRDLRLFNKDVGPDSRLKFFDDSGKLVDIPLQDLLVNFGASDTDKVVIKAGASDRGARRRPKVTEDIRDRMKTYGAKVKKGQDIDLSLLVIGLDYPADEIRAFFTAVWRRSKHNG